MTVSTDITLGNKFIQSPIYIYIVSADDQINKLSAPSDPDGPGMGPVARELGSQEL